MKEKNCMIGSIDTEKTANKIQHSFMIKFLNRLDIEKNILQHNKGQIQQTHC